MRIALTGTPGTGKTTVAALLPYKVIDINALVKGGLNLGKDEERDCLEADMDGLAERLRELDAEEVTVLEGHFSHRFAGWAIVLRLAPSRLEKRFEARGYSQAKTRENLEAEALDIILAEAAEICGRVDEIDTTDKNPQEVANLVMRIIEGDLRLPPGQVDWLMDFFGAE
jgi:adenylate kinase